MPNENQRYCDYIDADGDLDDSDADEYVDGEDKGNADGDEDGIIFWATFAASKLHIKSTCPRPVSMDAVSARSSLAPTHGKGPHERGISAWLRIASTTIYRQQGQGPHQRVVSAWARAARTTQNRKHGQGPHEI